MSQLAAMVAAALPPAEAPLTCHHCGTALVPVRNLGRTGKHYAHHGRSAVSAECPLHMATWGYFDTASELRAAAESGEGIRLASPEAVAQITEWIAAGLMIIDRKKREEG
jgi:hypothetical protein